VDDSGVKRWASPLGAPLVEAAGGQHVAVDRAVGIGRAMAQEHLLGDDIETDAADARTASR
jgi:cell wall assembly regulator SMI1